MEQTLNIYSDYGTGLSAGPGGSISKDNFIFPYLQSNLPISLTGGPSTYHFKFFQPDFIPTHIKVFYSGSGFSASPPGQNPSQLLQISLNGRMIEPIDGMWETIASGEYLVGQRCAIRQYANGVQFSRILNRGSLFLNQYQSLSRLMIVLEGDQSIINYNSPISDPISIRPRYVTEFGSSSTSFYPSSGDSLLGVLGPDSEYIYTGENIGNALTYLDRGLRLRFDKIGQDILSSLDKVVVRIKARNTKVLSTNNYKTVFCCQVVPRVFVDDGLLSNTSSSTIMSGMSTDIVEEEKYYDIDLSFRDPFNKSLDGFKFYKRFDSIALLDNSDILITNIAEGTEILDVEILAYKNTSNYIPLFTKTGVELKKDETRYLSRSTNIDTSGTFYTEGEYARLFGGGGYFDFRELSGNVARDLTEEKVLKCYRNGEERDITWFSRYKGNKDSLGAVSKHAVYLDNEYLTYEAQPNIDNDFSLSLNVSASGLSHSNMFSGAEKSLLFYHGTSTQPEFQIYHDSIDNTYKCEIYSLGGFPTTIQVPSVNPLKQSENIILQCFRNPTENDRFDYMLYNTTAGHMSLAYSSNNRKYRYPNAKSYIFGAPSGYSSYPNAKGYVNGFGISTSGWSQEDYQIARKTRESIGERLNKEDFSYIKVDNADTNLDISAIFSDFSLNNNSDNLYEFSIRDFAYGQITQNPSGLHLNYIFDNNTDREITIYGDYQVTNVYGENMHMLYSGIIPSGLDQNVKLYPYSIDIDEVSQKTYSFDSLTTNFKTEGSGSYNLDLKWKGANLVFDAWMIPITGFESVPLATSGGKFESLDFYLHNALRSGSIDLKIGGKDQESNTVDFYTEAGLLNDKIDFSTKAVDVENEDLSLFLNSATKIDNEIDLFTHGALKTEERLNLNIEGTTPEIIGLGIDMVSRSSEFDQLSKRLDMILTSNLDNKNQINMVIKSSSKGEEIFPMFIEQNNSLSNIIDFIVENNHEYKARQIPMFTQAPGSGLNNVFNMCIKQGEGNGQTQVIPFASFGSEMTQEDISFFLHNAEIKSSGVDFFISGSGTDGAIIELYTHGF